MTFAVVTILLLVGCGGSSSGTTTNSTTNTTNLEIKSKNGILTYKNLKWQDNESVKDGSEYAYRNDYCDALSLGEYNDWRLPSVDEFHELYEVRSELKYLWSDLDIYWTSDETSTHILTYNLNLGRSGLFMLNRVGSYKWGIRCVRDIKVEEK